MPQHSMARDGPLFVDLDDARNGPAITGFMDAAEVARQSRTTANAA